MLSGFLKRELDWVHLPKQFERGTYFFQAFWDQDSAEHNLGMTAVATRSGTSVGSCLSPLPQPLPSCPQASLSLTLFHTRLFTVQRARSLLSLPKALDIANLGV